GQIMIHIMKTPARLPVAFLLLSVAAVTLAACDQASLGRPKQTIFIEARYPGADARVVADIVAAPIEQQIDGVEKLLMMRSRSSDDGRCRIALTFAPDIELNEAVQLVVNRANLASPVLPESVQRAGVMVRKESAGIVLILFLSSPDGR